MFYLSKRIKLSLLLSFLLQGNAMTHNYPGLLCAIEGIDGSGKTTVIQNLQTLFDQTNIDILITKEPGATQLGKQIRHILLEQTSPTCSKAEFLLFAADRAQHFETVIIPHLQKGTLIISDRMSDSSLAYQGYVKGVDLSMINTVNSWCMQEIQPDIVFYLRIDAPTAIDRIKNSRGLPNKFEETILEKMQLLINGFETIIAQRSNVIILDANTDPEFLTQKIFDIIMNRTANRS